MFTYQPYYHLQLVPKKEIYEWADERGLNVNYIGMENSWYSVGQTTLIEMEIGEESEYINYIKSMKRNN